MMKLLHSCMSNTLCSNSAISRVFSSSSYSLSFTSSLSSSAAKDTLYGRLMPFGNPRDSMEPILDQWVEEGRPIEKQELTQIIKLLRKYRRFNHALEVAEWMSNKRYIDQSPADVAVRLDLISKIHGPEQAEKYFDNVPDSFKGLEVYGALLHCYAHSKSVEKAEALTQKMRELGFLQKALPYNVLMTLYSNMGKHENLDSLMKEMEEKNIPYNSFTFNIRLNAYALASDMKGMEMLLKKMKADHPLALDWHVYSVAANGYLRAGNMDKAKEMLKKLEQSARGRTKRLAYEVLLTLYASAGDKDGVFRVWNLCKRAGKVFNVSYLTMISSLLKLDDFEGAEQIYKEWEAVKTFFDCRVPNTLISAYCKKGLLGKAEAMVDRLIQSSKELKASTWGHLAAGYHQSGQMVEAVKAMKKALLASHSQWKPNVATLAACMEYLKGKEKVEGAEDFVDLLRMKDHVPPEFCNGLSDWSENGSPESEAVDSTECGDHCLEGERGIGIEEMED